MECPSSVPFLQKVIDDLSHMSDDRIEDFTSMLGARHACVRPRLGKQRIARVAADHLWNTLRGNNATGPDLGSSSGMQGWHLHQLRQQRQPKGGFLARGVVASKPQFWPGNTDLRTP